MPNDGEADRSVRIVEANAQADESVFVVNNLVVAGSPSQGDVPVVQADGSLAWGAGGGGGGRTPVYWAGSANGIHKITLANILASDPIVWSETQNVGGFILSVDGTTLTIPTPGLFVVVLHISEYDNSDGVMTAFVGGNGFDGSRSAALTPLAGDDYAESETTAFTTGWADGPAALVVTSGYGTNAPTKGSFTADLTAYQIA